MSTNAEFIVDATLDRARAGSSVSFGHLPALDGIRAIAIVTVMFYHASLLLPGLKACADGGFLGVDIFFVLSGFLITSVLLREHDRTGSISLKKFFARRFLRLAPAFWLFLGGLFLFGNFLLPADQAELIYSDNNFLYSFLYVLNYHRALSGPVTGNLNHIWSLSIEEQFYLIWSLVLFKAFAGTRSRWQIAGGTGIFVFGLILARAVRAAAGTGADILYYSTETRIDALLIGCLASMIYCWKLLPLEWLTSKAFDLAAGTAAVVACLILLTSSHENTSLYFGLLSLFAICVAVSILWLSSREASVFHSALANPVFRWIGRISYSLYLWHYCMFEFAKKSFDSVPLQVLTGVGLALLAASASLYLFEAPILKMKDRFAV